MHWYNSNVSHPAESTIFINIGVVYSNGAGESKVIVPPPKVIA